MINLDTHRTDEMAVRPAVGHKAGHRLPTLRDRNSLRPDFVEDLEALLLELCCGDGFHWPILRVDD